MSRDEMITQRIPQVRFIAQKLWRKLGCRRDLEMDDLISAGYVGLVEAVDRYDGSTKLTTFVRHRIEGAMLDYLREIDPLTRTHRALVKGTAAEPKHVDADDVSKDICDRRRDQARVLARTTLEHLMDSLSEKERFVIAREQKSRMAIANELRVSVEKVCALRRSAIEKMSREAHSQQIGLFIGERYMHSMEVAA